MLNNMNILKLCLKIFIDVQTCIWYGTLSTVTIKKFIRLHIFRNISSCVWPHWEWFLLVFPSLSLLTLLQMSPSHPSPCLPPPSPWAPPSGHHHTIVCVCGWCTYGVGQNQVYSCEYIKEFILYCYLLVVFSIWTSMSLLLPHPMCALAKPSTFFHRISPPTLPSDNCQSVPWTQRLLC